MIWYDMIWYDMIWYDMIWYDISSASYINMIKGGRRYILVNLQKRPLGGWLFLSKKCNYFDFRLALYGLICVLYLKFTYQWKTHDPLPLRQRYVWEKSILEVPDTGTWVLDNTKPFLCSSIINFWITLAHSKEHKYHIFRQYWYTRNVPVFTNTGTFQHLGPQVYFFPGLFEHNLLSFLWTS